MNRSKLSVKAILLASRNRLAVVFVRRTCVSGCCAVLFRRRPVPLVRERQLSAYRYRAYAVTWRQRVHYGALGVRVFALSRRQRRGTMNSGTVSAHGIGVALPTVWVAASGMAGVVATDRPHHFCLRRLTRVASATTAEAVA